MKCWATRHPIWQELIGALIFVVLGCTVPANADVGQRIYQLGQTSAEKVFIGKNALEAPATLFPCLNCHGERGAGAKEGGISAPNTTWQQLLQPFRKDLSGGRPRPPYDYSSFKNALISGISSEGEPLDYTMPRYALEDAEIGSLINYLMRIDQQKQRGVEETKIDFLLRLPDNPELARIIRETVTTFAEHINKRGGVYRRKLVLHEIDAANVVPNYFCILDFRLLKLGNHDKDILSLSVFAKDDTQENDYALYNHPSEFHELKSTLANGHGLKPVRMDGRSLDTLIKELKQLDTNQLAATALIHEPANSALEHLLSRLMTAQVSPAIVSESSELSPQVKNVIAQYPAPVFVLNPPGPQSVSVRGQRMITELSAGFKDPGKYLSARLWSLALMQLLVITLEQSGKDLSEYTFMNALHSHVELDTGFGPALSYSANRKIGNDGAQFVRLN